MQPLARRLACALACLVLGCSLAAVGPAWAITPKITEFSTGLNPGANTNIGIAAGPDGNLWVADRGTPTAIGRITPAGAIHEFGPAGGNPYGIAKGLDGNLWFSDSTCAPGQAIGRVTPAGAIHLFTAGFNAGSCPYFIAAGADGSLWFTDE